MSPYTGLGVPFVKDSDTSEAAAHQTDAETGRRRILTFFYQKGGGATVDEVEVALSMLHQTASARVRDLVMSKQLRDSGLRRLTRSGRKARVMILR